MTTTHTHTAARTGPDRCFTGSVAVAPFTEEDCRAHGGVTYEEECACGARRSVNANQSFREEGPWGPDREARRAGMTQPIPLDAILISPRALARYRTHAQSFIAEVAPLVTWIGDEYVVPHHGGLRIVVPVLLAGGIEWSMLAGYLMPDDWASAAPFLGGR